MGEREKRTGTGQNPRAPSTEHDGRNTGRPGGTHRKRGRQGAGREEGALGSGNYDVALAVRLLSRSVNAITITAIPTPARVNRTRSNSAVRLVG
jgi:hypothetical protein